MKILALETSSELASCALWIDGEVRACEGAPGLSSSEVMLPLIDTLLAAAGVKVRGLDAVAFGAGPGSFTGLRVACGLAQGIALSADLPVVPIGTLHALAAAVNARCVIACIDARMSEVYHARYERRDDGWRECDAPSVLPPGQVPVPDAGEWFGVGTGFAAYADALAARLGARITGVDGTRRPHAREVALLAHPLFVTAGGLAPEDAVPVYLRNKVALRTDERPSR